MIVFMFFLEIAIDESKNIDIDSNSYIINYFLYTFTVKK
jgi:hypothetical protein